MRKPIALNLLPFLGLGLFLFLSLGNATGSNLNSLLAQNTNGLVVVSHKAIADEYSRYVVGIVKNNSNKHYKYVQVEINLYDKSGAQVGSTIANVNNLEPHGTWKFKAIIMEDNTKRYQIKGITAF
jgi:hypothetical protein